MTSIGKVIGWKFNNQPGMRTRAGIITQFPGGIPSKEDQDSWTLEYEAHIAKTQYIMDREAAMQELLPDTMCFPAILEQAKIDRGEGKILGPEMDEVVNIYTQILEDHPQPI